MTKHYEGWGVLMGGDATIEQDMGCIEQDFGYIEGAWYADTRPWA